MVVRSSHHHNEPSECVKPSIVLWTPFDPTLHSVVPLHASFWSQLLPCSTNTSAWASCVIDIRWHRKPWEPGQRGGPRMSGEILSWHDCPLPISSSQPAPLLNPLGRRPAGKFTSTWRPKPRDRRCWSLDASARIASTRSCAMRAMSNFPGTRLGFRSRGTTPGGGRERVGDAPDGKAGGKYGKTNTEGTTR